MTNATATQTTLTTMQLAGMKAAETRRRMARHEEVMELGSNVCAGSCGKPMQSPRTQTQGLPIWHAECAERAGVHQGRRYARD